MYGGVWYEMCIVVYGGVWWCIVVLGVCMVICVSPCQVLPFHFSLPFPFLFFSFSYLCAFHRFPSYSLSREGKHEARLSVLFGGDEKEKEKSTRRKSKKRKSKKRKD